MGIGRGERLFVFSHTVCRVASGTADAAGRLRIHIGPGFLCFGVLINAAASGRGAGGSRRRRGARRAGGDEDTLMGPRLGPREFPDAAAAGRRGMAALRQRTPPRWVACTYGLRSSCTVSARCAGAGCEELNPDLQSLSRSPRTPFKWLGHHKASRRCGVGAVQVDSRHAPEHGGTAYASLAAWLRQAR